MELRLFYVPEGNVLYKYQSRPTLFIHYLLLLIGYLLCGQKLSMSAADISRRQASMCP